MSSNLSTFDLTILLAYLAAAVGLGLWLGRGQRNIGDYLLGGRNLPWWAVLGSIVATETSTATFLSVPGLAFAAGGDLTFLQLAFGYVIGRIAVVWLFLPRYFEGTLFTSYEVLHRRFGGATKQTASLMFLVTRNAADGLRLYLAAIALEKAAGIPLTWSVIVMGVATILYTFFGGMKSVVWNDCIQFVVYIGGAVLAAVVIVNGLPGGVEQVLNFAAGENKLTLFNFSLDPRVNYTIWSGLIGGAFLTLGTHGTDQLMVQRYLAARSRRDAGRAVIASGLVVLAQFALFLLIGVGLAAWYAEFPPETPIAAADEAFATFIVAELPPGAVGLVLAAVFSAAMSTLSSSLNSSATAAVNDFYRPWRERRYPPKSEEPDPDDERRLLKISRWLTVLFGLVQIGIGIAARDFAGNVVSDVLSIAGFTTGIILGVFLLGSAPRQIAQPAALVGLATGLAVMTTIKFLPALLTLAPESRLAQSLSQFVPLAWPWYTIVGATVTVLAGLAASLVISPRVSQDQAK